MCRFDISLRSVFDLECSHLVAHPRSKHAARAFVSRRFSAPAMRRRPASPMRAGKHIHFVGNGQGTSRTQRWGLPTRKIIDHKDGDLPAWTRLGHPSLFPLHEQHDSPAHLQQPASTRRQHDSQDEMAQGNGAPNGVDGGMNGSSPDIQATPAAGPQTQISLAGKVIAGS